MGKFGIWASLSGLGLVMAFAAFAETTPVPTSSSPVTATPDGYFNYSILNYPKEGGTCADRIQAVASRLVQVTGVRLWSTTVTHETGTTCDAQITYRAPKELPLVTTLRAEIDESPGTYVTLQECVADLGRQIDYFERATGLQWVVAYCDPEPFFGWDHPVAVHIDALGEAVRVPRRFYDFIGGMDKAAQDAMLSELVHNATRQSLYLSQIIVGQDEAMLPRIVVDYYDSKPLPLRLWNRLEYDSVAQCQTKLGDLRRGLAAGNVDALTVFCSGGESQAVADVLSLDDGTVDFYQAPQTYHSVADCEADKARVMKELHDDSHWDVRAAFCGGVSLSSDPEFSMYVLHHRTANDLPPNQPVNPFPPPAAKRIQL